MNARITTTAVAVALGIVVSQAAIAAPTTVTAQAFLGGMAENQSVAYAGAVPRGTRLAPTTIGGTGENISVAPPAAAFSANWGYVAAIGGTGDNQSVSYLSVEPGG